jgi:hypothetical protein
MIGKDRRALTAQARLLQRQDQIVTVKDVIAENQCGMAVANERLADEEGLSEPVRARLYGILDIQSPPMTVAEQLLEARRLRRRRDDQHLPYPREHQSAQRIVDHRLVVNRQELFGHGLGHRIQPRARTARKYDSLTLD